MGRVQAGKGKQVAQDDSIDPRKPEDRAEDPDFTPADERAAERALDEAEAQRKAAEAKK
jgi:hypothetical protein